MASRLSLQGKTVSFDEAISGFYYYFMRLPSQGYASPRKVLLRGSVLPCHPVIYSRDPAKKY
ncbi:MAG: hypothetical protein ACRYE8_01725 [Janthinobacterium lividum]